jgi:hypothetical protein
MLRQQAGSITYRSERPHAFPSKIVILSEAKARAISRRTNPNGAPLKLCLDGSL